MTTSISSAKPLELFRYSDRGVRIAADLLAGSCRLSDKLQRFQATCIEYCVPVTHLPGPLQSYARQTEGTDRWVREVGVAFQNADRLAWTHSLLATLIPSLGLLRFIKDDLKTSKTLLEIRDIARGLHSTDGSTYPGQVRLYGSDTIKQLVGWSPSLTHLKLDPAARLKLSGQTGWSTFKDVLVPARPVGRVLWGLTIVIRGYENWENYKSEGPVKIAVGTIVDSALTIALAAAGAGAGAAVGGFIGGALLGAISGGVAAPVGVAIGGKIGGFVGGYLGARLADKIIETKAHDAVVDAIDRGVRSAVQTGAQLARDAVQTFSETASAAVAEGDKRLAEAANMASGALQNALEEAQNVERLLVPALNPLVALF